MIEKQTKALRSSDLIQKRRTLIDFLNKNESKKNIKQGNQSTPTTGQNQPSSYRCRETNLGAENKSVAELSICPFFGFLV